MQNLHSFWKRKYFACFYWVYFQLFKCYRISLNDAEFGWSKLWHFRSSQAALCWCCTITRWVAWKLWATSDHPWRDRWANIAETLKICCLHERWRDSFFGGSQGLLNFTENGDVPWDFVLIFCVLSSCSFLKLDVPMSQSPKTKP